MFGEAKADLGDSFPKSERFLREEGGCPRNVVVRSSSSTVPAKPCGRDLRAAEKVPAELQLAPIDCFAQLSADRFSSVRLSGV
jgi:hypothetical protein